jgi:hypothetical protein
MISRGEAQIRVKVGTALLLACVLGLAYGGLDTISPGTMTFLLCAGIMVIRTGTQNQ